MNISQLNTFISGVVSRSNYQEDSNLSALQLMSQCFRQTNTQLNPPVALTLDQIKQKYIEGSAYRFFFNNEREIREQIANKLQLSDDGKVIIQDDLDLRYSVCLRALPDELTTITGNLNLFKCTGIRKLPKELTVHRNLNLTGCTMSFSSKLTVHGNIITEGLRNEFILERMKLFNRKPTLSNQFINDGAIICLEKIQFNYELPAYDKELELREIINRRLLLTMDGELEMHTIWTMNRIEFTELRGLPKDLVRVIGPLHLPSSSIVTLPTNLKEITGYANLSNCRQLTDFNNQLESIDGDLDLENCENFSNLSPNLNVNGNINLKNCRSLINLPPGLTFTGTLNLSGCKNLVSIPDSIINQGRIIIPEHLTHLETLDTLLTF